MHYTRIALIINVPTEESPLEHPHFQFNEKTMCCYFIENI